MRLLTLFLLLQVLPAAAKSKVALGPWCPHSAYAQSRDRQLLQLYDNSSPLWESIWGDHLHHGYYHPNPSRNDYQQAQVDMVTELLRLDNVTAATNILDVGCGIGGSTRHLAKLFNATATGITLSPVQARRAAELSRDQHLTAQTSFSVNDALQ